MQDNPFFLPKEQYTRRTDWLGDYIKDGGFYLSKMTGDDIKTCTQFVAKNMTNDGLFPIQDPRALAIKANEYGDRSEVITTLGSIIQESIQNDDLISPTFTTFYQPSVKESPLRPYVRGNKAKRKAFKKKMYEYTMAGDAVNADIYNKFQNNTKLANNNVSGAFTIFSTPLGNPTAHAVLTSTCRITSGYGNANNEKLIAGNRHYWSPKVVISNITSIVRHTDYDRLSKVVEQYNLVCPTVEQTMQCIKHSTQFYWDNPRAFNEIETYLSKLNPLERAAFVYTGDLYHLRVFNEEVIRTLITKLITPVTGENQENSVAIFGKLNMELLTLALQIFEDEVRGIALNTVKDDNDPLLKKVVATTLHIESVLREYSEFIQVFFTTTNVPASLYYFPDSVRRVAITSDTDSTIFTTQEWVHWYHQGDYYGSTADAVAGTICMFAAMTIVHILALMSANMGVKEEDLEIIAMKNEYKFPVFAATNVSKHYMALMSIQEGNVYAKPKKEIKGVHMKSSNAPALVNAESERRMLEIMDTILKGNKVRIYDYLTDLADSERAIIDSIQKGSTDYLRTGKIKEKEAYPAYEKGLHSPYSYHLFWNEVFGPKYGTVPEPPYLTIKIKVENLDTATKIKDWLDTMQDKELAKRFAEYCVMNKKTSFETFYIPEQIVQTTGIPQEILQKSDYRGLIQNIHKTHYIILETLGFYFDDKNVNRLALDYF